MENFGLREIMEFFFPSAGLTGDLSHMIAALLEQRKPGNLLALSEDELQNLSHMTRTIVLSQPMLLELEAPLNICGDIHGHYHYLLELFEHGGVPPESNYLFLGDYVDRGRQSIETICLLMCYKVKYPENFFCLRGNHESASLSRIYGFYDECKRRYDVKLWRTFCDAFDCFPVAAVVDKKILCMHGGLSPEIMSRGSLEQIKRIARPTDVPDSGLLCDLLWADPAKDVRGFSHNNDRGTSFKFGPDVVQSFLHTHGLDLICRAHQVVQDGYAFFAQKKLITVFSTPNYCGKFDNVGAILAVDETLKCSFKVLKTVCGGNGKKSC